MQKRKQSFQEQLQKELRLKNAVRVYHYKERPQNTGSPLPNGLYLDSSP